MLLNRAVSVVEAASMALTDIPASAQGVEAEATRPMAAECVTESAKSLMEEATGEACANQDPGLSAREALSARMSTLAKRRRPDQKPRMNTPAWLRRLQDEVVEADNDPQYLKAERKFAKECKAAGVNPPEALVIAHNRQAALVAYMDGAVFSAGLNGGVNRHKKRLHELVEQRTEQYRVLLSLRERCGLDQQPNVPSPPSEPIEGELGDTERARRIAFLLQQGLKAVGISETPEPIDVPAVHAPIELCESHSPATIEQVERPPAPDPLAEHRAGVVVHAPSREHGLRSNVVRVDMGRRR